MMSRELKSIRFKNGITQEPLAEKLEMSVTAYSKRENGQIEFNVTEIKKLKDALVLNDDDVIRIFFGSEVA